MREERRGGEEERRREERRGEESNGLNKDPVDEMEWKTHTYIYI